jgi:hypothetical protein
MFRTRDFLLVSLLVGLLVLAIFFTVAQQQSKPQPTIDQRPSGTVITDVTAIGINPPESKLNRQERLAALRQQIAAHQ